MKHRLAWDNLKGKKVGVNMNYIREIRAFYDWLEVNPLPPGVIALWHALMHINNKTAWSCEFTVANKMLESLTGLSRQGLDRARGLLIQRGLIEYTKGRGNKAGKYKIKSVCNIVGTVVDTPVDTVVDTKRTQTDTQSGHSSSTLNKLNKTKQKDDDDDDDGPAANAENIVLVLEQEFGRPISPYEAEKLLDYIQLGMDQEVVVDAIKRAKLQGKATVAYVDGILKNWRSRGVKSLGEVRLLDQEYEAKKKAIGQGAGRGEPDEITKKRKEKFAGIYRN